SGLVILNIYDVLGTNVATLVNEIKEAGNHSVKFNAENLPSGIYFYELNAGGFVQTKKMNLMK
ncbi:MAG: T9SS type A sorting domain-containing protein, partial [Ignavibacteriaceae bacterium]|nr:T9SS type A sorting domain-containing protein [Ignavibacteriaceae bacterium]